MAIISEGIMTITEPVQHKRGTSAALSLSDYVPAAGEIVVATDTGELKAGDGVRTWRQLPSYTLDLNDRITALEGVTVIDCGELQPS